MSSPVKETLCFRGESSGDTGFKTARFILCKNALFNSFIHHAVYSAKLRSQIGTRSAESFDDRANFRTESFIEKLALFALELSFYCCRYFGLSFFLLVVCHNNKLFVLKE